MQCPYKLGEILDDMPTIPYKQYNKSAIFKFGELGLHAGKDMGVVYLRSCDPWLVKVIFLDPDDIDKVMLFYEVKKLS